MEDRLQKMCFFNEQVNLMLIFICFIEGLDWFLKMELQKYCTDLKYVGTYDFIFYLLHGHSW